MDLLTNEVFCTELAEMLCSEYVTNDLDNELKVIARDGSGDGKKTGVNMRTGK